MERISVIPVSQKGYKIIQNKQGYFLSFFADGIYAIDSVESPLNIKVNSGLNVTLIEEHKQGNNEIEIASDASLKHEIINFANKEQLDVAVNTFVSRGANYEQVLLDLDSNNVAFATTISLLEDNARASYFGSHFASSNNTKKIAVKIINNKPNTSAQIEAVGLSKDTSKLEFTGYGEIKRGAKGASSKQKCNLLILDATSFGSCKPILAIDEADVVASHSNSVGTIPSEILFYLKSRGLHEKQIKELMILGYTKPVITKIDDLDLQKQILGKLGAEL